MLGPKIFLFGLDNAGKTSISNFIKDDEVADTRPTLAYNIDKWVIDSVKFEIWDAPGQLNLRVMWKNGFSKARILVFILDTADFERYEEAKKELDHVLNDFETQNIPLLFCYHKMDLEASKEHINDARAIFKLPLINDRPVHTFKTSIHEDAGVKEFKNQIVTLIQESRW